MFSTDATPCDIRQKYAQQLRFHEKDDLLILEEGSAAPARTSVKLANAGYLLYCRDLYRYRYLFPGGLQSIFMDIWRNHRKPLTMFAVAIDDQYLCKSEPTSPEIKAYIYGPKGLTKKQLQDDRFPSRDDGVLTVHVAEDNRSKAQIFWSRRSNLKSVQIEEMWLPDDEDSADQIYRTRYLHAIWNCKTASFEHVDGALKYYTRQSYNNRFQVGLDSSTHALVTDKRKLFRLDGSIQFDLWLKIVGAFYTDSWLVLEYFSDGDTTVIDKIKAMIDFSMKFPALNRSDKVQTQEIAWPS